MNHVALIKRIIAAEFGISMHDFTSPRRDERISWPRQIAMSFCRELTDLSFQEIGGRFKRDHGTVRYACKEVESRCEVEHKTKITVDRLRWAIREEIGK